MKQITAAEFNTLIEKNPSWASKIEESYEITDYCDMTDSNITDLSPLLTFSGDDRHANCAVFRSCKNLKIATGNFNGYVDFSHSGIYKIKNLHIQKPDKDGYAANFRACKNLKVATGNYPGLVVFSCSGISEIKNLFVGKDKFGEGSYLDNCQNLKILSGDFEGRIHVKNTPIESFKDFNAPILYSDDAKILKKFYSSKKLNELKEILSDKTHEFLIKNHHLLVEKEIQLRKKLKEKAAGIQLHGF